MNNNEKDFEVYIKIDEIIFLLIPMVFIRMVSEASTLPIRNYIVKYNLYDNNLMGVIFNRLELSKKGENTKLNLEESIYIYTAAIMLTNSYNAGNLRDLFDNDKYGIADKSVDILIKTQTMTESVLNKVLPEMIDFYKDSPAFKARMDLLNNKIFNVN